MQRKINLVTVIGFAVLIFGFALAFLILPDNSFSEQENRSLRTFPSFSLEKLASGEFSDEINDYFADQFPMRDTLVGLKGVTEIALGKGENNGILLGDDGQLAERLFAVYGMESSSGTDLDAFDVDHIRASAEGLNRVTDSLNVPFTVLLTGRTVDIAASVFDYPADVSNALQQTVKDALNQNVSYVETIPMLREKYDSGEYVYYKTDHHWTALGAYYAYVEVMKSFGMEADILPAEAFEKETVATAFYGTAWSAGGMKFVPPDSMEFWLYGNEDTFTVTADGRELDGFYSRSYLEKKDKYSAFLDGTHDVVTVTKNTGEERPTLLLFKDSFANALAPFLAQHFDLVLLNLSSARTDYTDVTSYTAQYGADRVLLVYTLENVITADKLTRFR
ncbi:MAG: hypothetical protein IJW55_00890 [Clostridia bacterium]|nr:hypothetical protein [Clostridia bacterium]